MEAYYDVGKTTDGVEMWFSYDEFEELFASMADFHERIHSFLRENKDNDFSGFTHLHFIDSGTESAKSDVDVVFYVKLDKTALV